MTEESIREIIQGIFLLPGNKNSDIKLDDNDLTHRNGIDLSPLITIKVEHDVDRSSANPERTNINNFAPNGNIKWGQYHRYTSKSTSNISHQQSHLSENGVDQNNGSIPSIHELCKSVNKIWFGHQQLRNSQITDSKSSHISKQIKSSSDSQLNIHQRCNGLFQDDNTIDKSNGIQDVNNNNQRIMNNMIIDDNFFMKIVRTSSRRKCRREITWDHSRAKDKMFNNQLLVQAFECDNLFDMLREIQRNNHFLNHSMARTRRDKVMPINILFADGIQFDTEDEMKAYLNKMPMMKEVLRNELEFIKKQHTKIKKDSSSLEAKI